MLAIVGSKWYYQLFHMSEKIFNKKLRKQNINWYPCYDYNHRKILPAYG